MIRIARASSNPRGTHKFLDQKLPIVEFIDEDGLDPQAKREPLFNPGAGLREVNETF